MNPAYLVACISLVLATCWGQKLKRAITPEDKELFRQMVQNALEQLKTTYQTIPDQSGESGKLKYSFTGIRITGMTIPGVDVVEVGPSALRLSLDGAGLSLRSDWRVSYKLLFTFRTSGSIDASVSGLNIAVTATVEDLPDGRVKIALTNCESSVRDVRVDIHGSLSFVLNLFEGAAERKVKGMIPDKICAQVRDYIIKTYP